MAARIEPKLLRKLNERHVIELIQQQGPMSRASVTRRSGLSAPTVSKAIASLIEVGLLEEVDAVETTFGRPAKLVKLAVINASVLGVVIEPDQCWVVASGLDGRIDQDLSRSFPTAGTYPDLLDKIESELHQLQQQLGNDVHGIGVTVPGLMHKNEGKVLFSPNLHLLDGHSPGIDLESRIGLKCAVLQESHALCLGERMFGGAQGQNDFAMIDISTGLGLGVMSGGRLLTGNSGLAGELGHITVDPHGLLCGCGNYGCLETLATDASLARMISQREGRTLEISEVVSLIRSRKLNADQELERVVEYLAIAVAAVINLFNPTVLFLHGIMFSATDDLFDHVVERARKRALNPSLAECRIVQARGSKRQAALAGIIQHLTNSWAPTLS